MGGTKPNLYPVSCSSSTNKTETAPRNIFKAQDVGGNTTTASTGLIRVYMKIPVPRPRHEKASSPVQGLLLDWTRHQGRNKERFWDRPHFLRVESKSPTSRPTDFLEASAARNLRNELGIAFPRCKGGGKPTIFTRDKAQAGLRREGLWFAQNRSPSLL